MTKNRYSEEEIGAVYRVIRERRDIRHFVPGSLPSGLIERLVDAAHQAPSVGLMQPWRFIRITDAALRGRIHAHVEAERHATAAALPSRNDEFMKVKVEGIRDCSELLVAALMNGREPHIFGRHTLPEMDLCSLACAIQNMWLAARAEGLGLGWVSFFDPEVLAKMLNMPDGAKPLGILCLGPVASFDSQPLLEKIGWGKRLPRSEILFENRWPADARPTQPMY